jgi:hypothetical protein
MIMAVTGPPQSANKLGRTSNAGWIEVADRQYDGPSMNLPKLPGGMKWMPQVEAWWEQIRAMPHCVLWTPTDWLFAIETAYMKQDWWSEYFGGTVHGTKSTEIRRREDQIGTTVEARRKLLIRYVDVELMDDDAETAPTPGVDPALPGGSNIASIADRRRRLAG